MKGKYYVEAYDGPRRRSLCLRTDSYELACQRYKDGLRELLNRIRKEHEAAKPKEQPKWLASEPTTVWDLPDGMEPSIENLELHGAARQTTAVEVLEPEQLRHLRWLQPHAEAASAR